MVLLIAISLTPLNAALGTAISIDEYVDEVPLEIVEALHTITRPEVVSAT